MRQILQPQGRYHFAFDSRNDPVAAVESGETVSILTQDAFGDRLISEEMRPADLSGYVNPVTGPIFVQKAEPGDCLKIEIIDIAPTRDWAVSALVKHFGGLVGTASMPLLHPPLDERVWIYHRQPDGSYKHSNKLHVPWKPFIGTIATSDALESLASLSPGRMGGNMDVRDICPGNTLYLPVLTRGAYLYVGDCHAAQGDGELCGVALEIAARVILRIELVKGKTIVWPRIENGTQIMTVGSAKPMEDAARIAYAQLIEWMVSDYGWDAVDAYQMLSQCGKMTVGNRVDTLYSMVAKIDKKFL